MEEHLAALEQAFRDYRTALEACAKKYRPTDGLLGFGHSIKDDPCHEQMDNRVDLGGRRHLPKPALPRGRGTGGADAAGPGRYAHLAGIGAIAAPSFGAPLPPPHSLSFQ